MWSGKGCTGDEREFAKAISKTVSPREYDILVEGSEPEAFWSALGGKQPYAEFRENAEVLSREPRLFQCTNAVGLLRLQWYALDHLAHVDCFRILPCGGDL